MFMIKKITVPFMAAMVLSTAAFASPLSDYSAGKTSVDMTWRPSLNITDQYYGFEDNFDGKKGTVDWRITTGLGNNWAIQYNHFNAISNSVSEAGVKTQELNLLYQFNKNASAFVGYHRAKYNYSSVFDVTTPAKNTMQIGLLGTTEIAKWTNLYGLVGFGKDLKNYEVGISYEFAKNTEFNISYRYKKVKDLDNTLGPLFYEDDVTAKGIGYGITYKF